MCRFFKCALFFDPFAVIPTGDVVCLDYRIHMYMHVLPPKRRSKVRERSPWKANESISLFRQTRLSEARAILLAKRLQCSLRLRLTCLVFRCRDQICTIDDD